MAKQCTSVFRAPLPWNLKELANHQCSDIQNHEHVTNHYCGCGLVWTSRQARESLERPDPYQDDRR